MSKPNARPRVQREWVVPFDDADAVAKLRIALNISESKGDGRRFPSDTLFVLVDRFGGLKVEVFSNEHPPPHFRVKCNGETANYRIDNCKQLNGGLKRYYREIRSWHSTYKPKLIEKWNDSRPTHCTVGLYKEG